MFQSATGKVTKHNLKNTKKKKTSSIRSISLTEADLRKQTGFLGFFRNLSALLNFVDHIFTVYTGKQHSLGAE